MQNLRNRLEQVQARREALQEEHGSSLENQNEIDRLKQVEKKNLQKDKNEQKEIAALDKIQKQNAKKQADLISPAAAGYNHGLRAFCIYYNFKLFYIAKWFC